jgi:hypothetical protein
MLRIAFLSVCALVAAACSKAEPVAQHGVAVSSATVGTEGAGAKGVAKVAVKSASPVRPNSTSTASKLGASVRPSTSKKTSRVDPSAPVLEGTELPAFIGRRISLIHTANMIGEIEPCG